MLGKRRHDRCLQIFDRISCIKVNRFILECQRVKFRGRQTLAYLCSFLLSSFLFISEEHWRGCTSFQSFPTVRFNDIVNIFYYIFLWLLLQVKIALGKFQHIYWVYPMCQEPCAFIHNPYIIPSLVIWHPCKVKTISMLPLLHTVHKDDLLYFFLKVKSVQEINCSSFNLHNRFKKRLK